ncbi:MBL fold metallo-hydrolase [Lusitaniella coriacea]|uniref:MBL fold metallo-hydrolase n=1 Tax=Lusitaniella coriacea TaxID=1983105 RepID=UPI003CF06DD0
MPPDSKPAALQSKVQPTPAHKDDLAVNFEVQFWGVRGQIATPGKETVRYGGNTSCVEMRVADQCLIFDGGTGLRQLGNSLLSRMPIEAHLFFTHCHWDRIQGFPFFVPAFIPINHIHIYGATASNGSTFKERLSGQMLGPNFPVPIQVMQSKMEFHDLSIEEKECLGNVIIETSFLNYSHRSIGYRITCQGKSVVYATGTKYFPDHLNENLLNLAHHADLVILDAPKVTSNGKNPLAIDWENTPWQISIETAKEAEVKQVVISLHNPEHSDDFLDKVEEKIQSVFSNAILAREGMILSL